MFSLTLVDETRDKCPFYRKKYEALAQKIAEREAEEQARREEREKEREASKDRLNVRRRSSNASNLSSKTLLGLLL